MAACVEAMRRAAVGSRLDYASEKANVPVFLRCGCHSSLCSAWTDLRFLLLAIRPRFGLNVLHIGLDNAGVFEKVLIGETVVFFGETLFHWTGALGKWCSHSATQCFSDEDLVFFHW